MQPGLDAIDMQILAQLQRDASVPVAVIAEAVGLSQSPCWRRIQRLEEHGYIRARVALLDHRKLGFDVEAVVRLRVAREARPHFEEAVRSMGEVTECLLLVGEEDYILRVVATDLERYERFVRAGLAAIAGVQLVEAGVAVATVKATHALPLEVPRKPSSDA
jgi:Lrp/AsnC family transcriptional regulator